MCEGFGWAEGVETVWEFEGAHGGITGYGFERGIGGDIYKEDGVHRNFFVFLDIRLF